LDYEIFFENARVKAQYDNLLAKMKIKVDAAFEMLKENPFRDEKLKGDILKGSWSYHVEKNFMIVHRIEQGKIIIRALGDHDVTYKELERYLRRLR
jgi:mRNA-degrading endonuclease YafQ of YafQ-DinJ toxin-antitoxin module